MMRRAVLVGLWMGAVLFTGCATSPYPNGGIFYTDVKGPNHAIENKGVGKSGMTCASSVLGVAGWGDASIETAKKQAGIEEVSAVDYSYFSVLLGAYTKTCALVSGN